jgi:hypothetical protein
MTKRYSMRAPAVLVLALGIAGCQEGERRQNSSGKSVTSIGRPLLPPAEASAKVDQMLYRENLIRDPQVSERAREAILRVTRDPAARDSVMPAFHRWLEDWAATHPVQAKSARLAGNSPVEGQSDVDLGSTVGGQTDSIRQLVRIRARRRIEAAQALDSTKQTDKGREDRRRGTR